MEADAVRNDGNCGLEADIAALAQSVCRHGSCPGDRKLTSRLRAE